MTARSCSGTRSVSAPTKRASTAGSCTCPDGGGVYDERVRLERSDDCHRVAHRRRASAQYADNIKYLNLRRPSSSAARSRRSRIRTSSPSATERRAAGGVSRSAGASKTFGLSATGPRSVTTSTVRPRLQAPPRLRCARGSVGEGLRDGQRLARGAGVQLGLHDHGGRTIAGFKPTALLTVDSTKVPAANLLALENALYGTAGTSPRLPLPDEVIGMFAGTLTSATPTQPGFTAAGGSDHHSDRHRCQYRRADTNAVVPARHDRHDRSVAHHLRGPASGGLHVPEDRPTRLASSPTRRSPV
jgi:hypothetical protein